MKISLSSILFLFCVVHGFAQETIRYSTQGEMMQLQWEVTYNDFIVGPTGDPLVLGDIILTPKAGFYINRNTQEIKSFNASERGFIKENTPDSIILFNTDVSVHIQNIYSGAIYYSNFREMIRPPVKSPEVVKGRFCAFALNDSTLAGFDIEEKKVIWTFESETGIRNTALAFDSVIYVGSNKYLFALDAYTGKELWKNEVGKVASQIIRENNILYFAVDDKGLYAFDLNNNTPKWFYKDDWFSFHHEISISDKNIYITTKGIKCIDKETGNLLWENVLGMGFDFCMSILNHSILVCASSDDGRPWWIPFNKNTGGLDFNFSKFNDNIYSKTEKYFADVIFYSDMTKDNMIYGIGNSGKTLYAVKILNQD